MAFNVGTGISAAKKSLMTVGLPMMVGAFVVAIFASFFTGKSG
ncbi:MAG TPA: hypothetical protein PKH75_10085 [Bacillota bacterium]|jgi:hypothetical protein|nr:hypothetical protein [Bacillota bacterium]